MQSMENMADMQILTLGPYRFCSPWAMLQHPIRLNLSGQSGERNQLKMVDSSAADFLGIVFDITEEIGLIAHLIKGKGPRNI